MADAAEALLEGRQSAQGFAANLPPTGVESESEPVLLGMFALLQRFQVDLHSDVDAVEAAPQPEGNGAIECSGVAPAELFIDRISGDTGLTGPAGDGGEGFVELKAFAQGEKRGQGRGGIHKGPAGGRVEDLDALAGRTDAVIFIFNGGARGRRQGGMAAGLHGRRPALFRLRVSALFSGCRPALLRLRAGGGRGMGRPGDQLELAAADTGQTPGDEGEPLAAAMAGDFCAARQIDHRIVVGVGGGKIDLDRGRPLPGEGIIDHDPVRVKALLRSGEPVKQAFAEGAGALGGVADVVVAHGVGIEVLFARAETVLEAAAVAGKTEQILVNGIDLAGAGAGLGMHGRGESGEEFDPGQLVLHRAVAGHAPGFALVEDIPV